MSFNDSFCVYIVRLLLIHHFVVPLLPQEKANNVFKHSHKVNVSINPPKEKNNDQSSS